MARFHLIRDDQEDRVINAINRMFSRVAIRAASRPVGT